MKLILRYISTMMITMPLVVFMASCSIHMKPVPVQYSMETVTEEKITLIKNNSGATVLWKKYIGTPFYRMSSPYYMLGGSPALLLNDKIFYQDQYYIYALDPSTGEIESTYSKPVRLESSQVNFEHACYTKDKIVFGLDHFLGGREYLIVNSKENDIQLHSRTYARGSSFCKGENIISVGDDAWVSGVVVREAVKGNELWKVKRYFSRVDALAFDRCTTFVAIRKGTNLFLRAYESNYDSGKFNGYDTGKLYWEHVMEISKDSESSLYKLDQLMLSEISLVRLSGELDGKIVSFDPVAGHQNWQLKNAIMLPARYLAEDGLVYASHTKLPGLITAMDQKTGEIKLKITVDNFNYLYGVIVTHDQLIFASTAQSGKNPFNDYISSPQSFRRFDTDSRVSFFSFDKKTGRQLWQSDFIDLHQMLHASDGILYFGGIGGIRDNYNNAYFSGGKKMHESGFTHLPKGVNPRNNLLDKVYFIDAADGKLLLTIVLEGNAEDYVENVFMKGNTAFIKSLSGWLYAIEINSPVHTRKNLGDVGAAVRGRTKSTT